ncbi:MAG: hypothetical protein GY828_02425, partial [Candidatus Gracilibacteria bacterium]|nr:hypothetical protein [Candidatus Gracilibacteria bacterium]
MIFQLPFPGLGIYAENKGIKNLVSIIVEEELYDAMKGSLNIYAKNISQTLENTQVLILPTPSDASPLEIASLNESLYFEGLYGLQKGTRDAKLVGTVLVGDFDLPVVYKEEKAEKTIIPYVDFEDKFFIYNHKNKQYENSQSNRDGLKADIWHGVISPNSGDKEKDLQLLKGYFTKNNHFYKGTGIFSAEKGIINGNADDVVSDIYEPYVFYFDQIRESKAMSHENYEAYKTYAENKEDIIYKRYNQELADKIQDQVRGGQKEFLDDVSHVLGDAIDVAELSKGPGLTNIPDIQTRHVINKTIKKFFEIYSKGSIGKLRKFVHNAGRYNESGNHVNVDFIPYLITVLDEVNDKIILDANTDIEGRIDGLITGGLSRKIAIPSNYVQKVEYSDEWIEVTKNELESPECPFGAEEEVGSDGITYCVTKEDKSYKSSYGDHYKNFYYGKVVRGPNSVKNAMDCSLYRGSRTASGTLVEANRSYNVERIQDDLNTIKFYPGAGDITGEDCLETLGESGSGLNGWFGKNTGLFLDSVKSKKGKLTLREGANKKGALVPLFDIKGSVNVNKDEDAKSSSYLQCLENNYYLDKVNRFIPNDDYEKGTFGQGKVIVDYRIPLNGSSPINWTCKTSNRKAGHIYETYDSLYLDGNCRIEEKCQTGNRDIYFKTIESLYEHKSPTAEEIGLEIASGITPALPIDRNRYADFMANTFDYAKIDYAYLFRTASGKSIEETKENIKKTLDQKSDEINQIIRDTDGEYPRIEAEIRAKFGSGMTLTKNSIQDELKFKEIVEEKEAEILDISGSGAAGVTGSSNGKIEDNYTEVSNKITNVLLKINELTTERDLFVDKKSELEGRIIELKNILSTYDVLDTGGKHCISGDCSAGWMSSTDRTSLIYEVELLDKLIVDYQKYIDQLALILYKLDVQKSEMSLLSSKLQLQVENLSQIWSSLEYDKNAINPIYEELNQRIQELNEAEKSFEITDKVDEIKERITYLFSAIDTLDIKDEETALLRLNANINTKNDLIIQTIGDQSSGILTEYQNKILAIESIIVSEKSLSVKKRTLAQNISIIGSGCKENDEGKVDTEKCKQVHESIEEYKLTPAYLNQVTEIANLNTLINASTESLYTGNILGTTENIETIIDDIESEISILGSIKEDFDIDILNVNNNIDSINSGIDLSASDIENTNNLLKDDVDKIEKVNDEIDDLGDLIQEKIDEIQIIHLNIQSIMNTGETYLLSNTIDDNPYDEVFSVRNNLWIQRDDLESKQSDLNLLETNTLSKQVILESEINSLLLHKSDLEAFLHEYSTKETDKKWYKCEGSVCNSWITEVTHTAITQELIDLDAIILEYQDHALDIDELLTLLSTNKIEITTLLSEVLAEIGAIDRYILSMRKDDIEYRQSLLGPIETNLITQRDVIQEHLNHVNTITGILTPFSELVDTEGDFINEYGFDAINDAFSGALLDSTNYFHNGEVSQKMTVTGTDVNGDPIFSFLYDYYSRSTVMGKLTRLDEVKIIAEERLLFLNTQITEITDKLSEKSDEVLQIDSLISEITEGNNDESTTRASLDTLVSDITNVLGKDNDVRIDFDTEKIDVLNSYGDDITLFVTLIDNFFTSKLGSVPVISPIVNPENIPRYGVYINTGIDYTSERNNILTTQLQVESRITTIENQFGIIDTRIDSIGDSSDELGEIYYIPLVLSIDSINFGLLSNINFIYNKIDNEILERQATLIVDKNITIGLLLDSTDLGTNPVLHMSNLLWTSLTGIEDYNKDDILEYNKNELQETVDDIDNIEADNFYGRATESERIGIVGDAGTGGQLDKDSNILYLTIEECIRLLRKVELYHMFKTSEFHPKDNVDLYKTLLENEKKTLTIGEDTKELEYIDSLAFAIYWESMTSVSEKYKFIIEHYLSDEFQNNDDKFHLPKNKKQYEIAYLGAQGDTQNMHIQMNPEKKEESPYLDILKKNAELQAQLLGENISGTSGKPKSEGSENNNGSSSGSDSDKKSEDGENEENNEGEEEKTSAVFKCAPPEGVPIYEWMPAITCWLDDMLPPKISVSDSSCGPTLDLLSEEDRDYIEQCDGDTDKNNINDCVEKKLEGGSLKMRTESQVYNFDSPGNISVSVLDSQNNGVSFDSSSEVQFTLVKIETGKDATQPFGPNNIQVVYDLSDPDLSDKSIISDYLNYEDRKIKVQGGVAELQFTSQNVEANFYFETKIETKDQHGEVQISIGSDVMKVEVRGDQLFATTYTIEKNEIDNEVSEEIGLENILANDVTQIYLFDLNKTNSEKLSKTIFEKSSLSTISLVGLENLSKSGEKLPISYPVKINVFDDEGKSIFHEYTLYSDDIKPYFEIPAIRESGFYTLDIVDSKGYKVKKSLEVSPNSPDHFKIDLGANMLQTGGAVSSNVVTILDKFDNPVIGTTYTVDINVSGNGLVFQNSGETSSSTQVIEGYKIFRLMTTDTKGKHSVDITLKDLGGNILLEEHSEIEVISDVNVHIIENNNLEVGGETYTLRVEVLDDEGEINNEINSRLYFTVADIYGKTTRDYFPVIQGVAHVQVETSKLANPEIPVEIQIEGMSEIFNDTISILHGNPRYLQLAMNNSSMEAKEGNVQELKIFIKDQFGNITYSYNDDSFDLELDEKYQKYISIDNESAKIEEGVGTINIEASNRPGLSHFKVTVGELVTAGQIETFYYLNEKTTKNFTYNALYTTLLGAAYGDYTQKGYLAGGLLFDSKNRSLAVTSLLNNPYKQNDVVMVHTEGGVNSIASASDLSTDISFEPLIENKKLQISVSNLAMGGYIGKIIPHIGKEKAELILCDGNSGDISDCNVSEETTSILLQSKSLDYNAYSKDDILYIQDKYGKKLFSIDEFGTIERFGNISFELSRKNTQNHLQLELFTGVNKIGELFYNFVDADIRTTRRTVNDALYNNLDNTIIVYLHAENYTNRDMYTQGGVNKIISYNSPFDTKYQLNEFHSSDTSGYENFQKNEGIGWKEGNKTLLSFAAGDSVGKSVQLYQSFSVINLGDPVLQLKKIQKTLPKDDTQLRNFDATIGKLLYENEKLKSYEVFDYNNDGKKDIILIHRDNYLELLEKSDGTKQFYPRGNVAHIYDLGDTNNIKAGNFRGDGYDDIFFVNDQGNPFLLNNNKKDFTRIDLTEQFSLSGSIVRTEMYDMDYDGLDDIIILDDTGTVSIHYGVLGNVSPLSEKVSLGMTGMPEINSEPRTDRGALYFNGLVSLGKTGDNSKLLEDSKAFSEAVQNNAADVVVSDANISSADSLDGLVFVQIPYSSKNNTDKTQAERLVSGIKTPLSKDIGAEIIKARKEISGFVDKYPDNIIYPETYPEVSQSDFIRSEYAGQVGIDIQKVYEGKVKGGSIVNFTLNITNNTDDVLKNIAYVETVLPVFALDETSIKTNKKTVVSFDTPGYEFLIDNFELEPGETLELTAQLKMVPIKFGYLRVGLFENGEVGDDKYGDVIVTPSHENCGETVELFRSCEVDSDNNGIDDCNENGNKPRVYRFGTKTPKCNAENIRLPDELVQNVEDLDQNGIPDYIDILQTGTQEEQAAYTQTLRESIADDVDGDGLPDIEDSIRSDGKTISNLEEINKNADLLVDGIDNLIQGLSCGFGGGGCIATPMNWAPLAPGGDPTLFGVPTGDGMNIDEGLPVFSALTWMPIYVPACFPIPVAWPISSSQMTSACAKNVFGMDGAGGYLGTDSPSNFFRLFVTPTLTGGVGIAACFGSTASVAGYANMPGISPLLPGGNCVVVAKPLSSCENDGSDGDPGSIGFPSASSGGGRGSSNNTNGNN